MVLHSLHFVWVWEGMKRLGKHRLAGGGGGGGPLPVAMQGPPIRTHGAHAFKLEGMVPTMTGAEASKSGERRSSRETGQPGTGRIQRVIVLTGFLLCFGLSSLCFAQEENDEVRQIMRGVSSSFSLPLRDLLEKKDPSEWRNLFHGFSGSFGFETPVQTRNVIQSQGQDSQGVVATSTTGNFNLRYNPLSYWFFQTTIYGYLFPDERASWSPDFTYVFGYDDWHPYTFSLVYANYTGNHFSPDADKGEHYSQFDQGTVSLGWKYVLPKFLEQLFIVHPTGGIGFGIYYNVTPSYVESNSTRLGEWKQSLSFTMRYVIYKWFYFNFAFYYYPDPSQRQPWDPDFTYGFGYFDWHPGTITIQYNNYSGNRYPWNKGSPNTGDFGDGSVSILYTWAW